jgi:2-polyprenyl-3-methyl-5-hydroxy-6-metoxy-1,4-benzoquinol methylase
LQDLDELKNELNSFHVITLFEVLEHLDNPLTILQSLSKLIAPGGVLILETPDCSGISNIQEMISYRKIHPLDHINAFTPKTLESIAGRAGFKKVKPCVSFVTTDRIKLIKLEIKQLLYNLGNVNTQQYFLKI